MIDEPRTPGAGPEGTGQETNLGGTASEWSTVPPGQAPAPPPEPVAPPAQSLEPLPPPPAGGGGGGGGVPSPFQPTSTTGSYQPVYGSQPQSPPPPPPGGYASAPGGGYPPPPPQGVPPGYGGGPQYPPGAPPPTAGQGLSSNAAAAIAYITFIPAVLFLVLAPYNRDRFVRFHAWQCIALTVVWVALRIIFIVFSMAGLHFMLLGLWTLIRLGIGLILFVFWLIALIKASQGQWYKIPIVGDLAASFAGNQV